MRSRFARVLAGRVSAVLGSSVTVHLWDDPDTSEVLEVDVPLAPSVGLGGTAYVSVTDDGSVVLGSPFGGSGQGVWEYRGTVVTTDPGPGGLTIKGTGTAREFAVSNTDAEGFPRNLGAVLPGDNVTLTDDPETPPVSGFARYVITGDPVSHGSWTYFTGTRTDSSGSASPPPVGTRLRVIATSGGGGGGGPYVVRFDTYQQLIDGIVIGG